jgi:hypothetical protein
MATQTCWDAFGLMKDRLAILSAEQQELQSLQPSADFAVVDALASPACTELTAITAATLRHTIIFFIALFGWIVDRSFVI